MIRIFIDADACPVKEEAYDVAARLRLPVVVVSNQPLWVPEHLDITRVVVGADPDAADDWIAAEIRENEIVITADIPLAARCLEVGAFALGIHGREFTRDAIGGALASRELGAQIREAGGNTRGPAPMSQRERSRFANVLDRIAHQALRNAAR